MIKNFLNKVAFFLEEVWLNFKHPEYEVQATYKPKECPFWTPWISLGGNRDYEGSLYVLSSYYKNIRSAIKGPSDFRSKFYRVFRIYVPFNNQEYVFHVRSLC